MQRAVQYDGILHFFLDKNKNGHNLILQHVSEIANYGKEHRKENNRSK
jgi:hypothetical protein